MKRRHAPPRLAFWLLDWLSGWENDYGAAGDFEEFYRALVEERGARRARRACWRQVLAALPGYLKNTILPGCHSTLLHAVCPGTDLEGRDP